MIDSNIICLDNYRNNKTPKLLSQNESLLKKRLYILIGIPGCGKSYYADHNLKDNSTVIISTDEIRKSLFGSYSFCLNTNNLVIKTAKENIKTELLNNNVIFDATNTNKKYRKSIINIGLKCNAIIIGIVFNTPLHICLERNERRCSERKVPKNIIMKMSSFDSNIDKFEEGFDSILYV
ncbi:ATP-binding protein [Clostridium sp. YIM B02505]|uniref:ATP-binding protein n=1 Tax=Clostridium yunnanense TaxID=2800325 RepID=A0ABS1EQL7_9CLOT|nr:ATP-binding protein [Clostridium yunnanense]MBK1811647.1 ATP-binding protein [Clostridium yunnanense]